MFLQVCVCRASASVHAGIPDPPRDQADTPRTRQTPRDQADTPHQAAPPDQADTPGPGRPPLGPGRRPREADSRSQLSHLIFLHILY